MERTNDGERVLQIKKSHTQRSIWVMERRNKTLQLTFLSSTNKQGD